MRTSFRAGVGNPFGTLVTNNTECLDIGKVLRKRSWQLMAFLPLWCLYQPSGEGRKRRTGSPHWPLTEVPKLTLSFAGCLTFSLHRLFKCLIGLVIRWTASENAF